MKSLKYIIGALTLLLCFNSCEKETEDVSRITYYVEITLEGKDVETVALGSAYNEPGYVAYEGEEEVSGNVVATDNININKVGVYKVNYSAVNKDGFAAGTSRTVVVYDPSSPATDISGTYSASTVRTESDGSNPRPRGPFEIKVTKIAPGMFYVNCLLGYYYAAGYGPAYAMTGYIQIDASNNLTEVSSFVAGWGDGLEALNNGIYNPADGSLYWESIYAGHDIFAVTSTK